MAPRNEPRLVLGFAVASLIAFVVVGLGATALLVRNARERAEVGGAQHALFVSQSVPCASARLQCFTCTAGCASPRN